jgi:HEAT repeat protein
MPLIKRPTTPTETRAPPDAGKIAIDLREGSDDERWAAARDASEIPDSIQLLSDAISSEQVPRVREAIFTALAKIGTPDSAVVLIPHLRSDDAARRTGALDALRAMPSAASAHLPLLLRDDDADVRLLACEIARNLPADEASRTLGGLIEREKDVNVCAAAVEVLAETGDSTILPTLARCAARFPDDPFLGFAVEVASHRIGSR